MKSKKGFSLLEVVIATSIITIAVFGVYKLIGENTKIIGNSTNLIQVNSLFPALEECIENIGFSNLIGSVGKNYNFNFGNDINKCFTGVSNEVVIDELNYNLKGIITGTGINYILWELQISSDGIGTIKRDYRQIK